MTKSDDSGSGGCLMACLWLFFLFIAMPLVFVAYERRMRTIEEKLQIEAPPPKGLSEMWDDLCEYYSSKEPAK